MKAKILSIMVASALFMSATNAQAGVCDDRYSNIVETVNSIGGSPKAYFDCLMEPVFRICRDELRDLFEEGYDADFAHSLLDIASGYKECKILEGEN